MRKPTLDPTDENILNTLDSDALGRNALLIDTITLLNNLEGNFTIALDSPWGGGKTFFVKQLQTLLQCCISDEKKKPSIQALMEQAFAVGYSKEKRFIPIYFNVWLYDNMEDPMLPLLYTVANYKEGKLKASVSLRDRLAHLISSVSATIGPVSISGEQLVDSLKSGESLIQPVIDQAEIKQKMYDFVAGVLEYENSRLLLIIDELDRCRPTFAVEVLERVKHFYDNDNIITLYSLNKSQLVHTIAHRYGSNCNATAYLNRFFDHTFSLLLSKNDWENYLKRQADFKSSLVDDFSNEIIRHFNFSIREATGYLAACRRVRDKILQNSRILFVIYVPFLMGLRLHDQQSYEEFIAGKSFEPLRVLLERNEFIVYKIWGGMKPPAGSVEEVRDEILKLAAS